MKVKLSALRRLSRISRILLAVFCVLVIGVVFVGLDNPPGIVLGWLAVTVLMGLMVRKWRKPRNFLILLFASIIGGILLSGLYMEVALPVARWFGGARATDSLAWRIFHVIVSDIILLTVPAGVFCGIAGSVALAITRLVGLWSKRSVSPDT